MGQLIYVGSSGSENPTKATFPFIGARGAKDAGIESAIVLLGDSVVLMKDMVVDNVVPMGWPPLKDIFNAVLEAKIPIYV